MEGENKGITFKGICATIWYRKWVALIVAVVVVLVCAISLFYGYNARAEYYEIEFSLNLPGSNSGVVYTYPDGAQFHYMDITSKKTLGNLKDSSEEFAGIDVDAMASKGRIHITRNVTFTADSVETSSTIREITYTISAKASCFSDNNQAKEFLMKLANTPADYLLTMNIENGVYLPMAEAAVDYEAEIDFLKNQLQVLQNEYNKLITTYGGSFVGNTETGKTLLAYSQEVKAYLDSGVLDNLLSQLREKHIIKSEDCKDYYQNMQSTLVRERDIKQAALNNVLKPESAGSSVIIDVDASVLQLSKEVEELNDKIKALDGYVSANDVKVQADFLNSAYEMVEGFTNTYTSTSKNVYNRASAVIYTQPGVVVSTGGMSLTKVALLSVVVGVVVALIAAYVAGYLALKKKNTSVETQPTEVDAEASEEKNEE